MEPKKSAEERRQENLKRIQDMCLMDDLFMSKCFEEDLEAIQLVLRIVLQMPDLKVLKVTVQRVLVSLKTRSVRLDILAEDGEGRRFNVEVQRDDSGADQKRARYHSSLLDVTLLEKGRDFKDLPETYVIFITEHDVLKKGWAVYQFERSLKGTGEGFGDGSHIVYVNGAYRDDSPIGKLMEDFACTDPAQMHYQELAKQARFFKEDRKGTAIMCRAMQENFEEGRAEGFEEGLEEGREEGREEGMEIVAANLLREGRFALADVARLSVLPIERVMELKEKLEAEERQRRNPRQWPS